MNGFYSIVSRPIPFVHQLGRRTPNGFSLTCLLLVFPGTDTSGELSGVRLKAGSWLFASRVDFYLVVYVTVPYVCHKRAISDRPVPGRTLWVLWHRILRERCRQPVSEH